MIRFEQQDGGTPKDILVITDDADAELADMTEAFQEADWTDAQAYANLGAATLGDYGLARFTIPGDEAGEVSEVLSGVVPLDEYLDGINQALIDEAERQGQ